MKLDSQGCLKRGRNKGRREKKEKSNKREKSRPRKGRREEKSGPNKGTLCRTRKRGMKKNLMEEAEEEFSDFVREKRKSVTSKLSERMFLLPALGKTTRETSGPLS